jgi:methionyl-tRNA synthetase
MTARLAKERGFDWKSWWQKPDEVELFQFIGKDNIPFHTVIFPSSLLGTGKKWTMLHHMSSTEYLNYEAGKFSKSKGIGVFGNDAMNTGIPADIWRFYVFWNRPETSDHTFTWADFQEKVNGELIGNLGNLVNRTLTFISRYYKGIIPDGTPDEAFWKEVTDREQETSKLLELADLRDAFRTIFSIADLANKRFQYEEPWKARIDNPQKASSLMRDLCYVLKDLAIMTYPYMPRTAEKLASFLGIEIGQGKLGWADLGLRGDLKRIEKHEVLFNRLEDELIASLRAQYSGSQKEREEMAEQNRKSEGQLPVSEEEDHNDRLDQIIDLCVARIIKIERHPKADRLYIETLDDGSGLERVIVSGLVPFYREDELLGKNIIIVNNLKPAKLRGIESKGMLLAASTKTPEGNDIVEVLTAPKANPGERVLPEDIDMENPAETVPKESIDIETFLRIPMYAKDGYAWIKGQRLMAHGEPIRLEKVMDGKIG